MNVGFCWFFYTSVLLSLAAKGKGKADVDEQPLLKDNQVNSNVNKLTKVMKPAFLDNDQSVTEVIDDDDDKANSKSSDGLDNLVGKLLSSQLFVDSNLSRKISRNITQVTKTDSKEQTGITAVKNKVIVKNERERMKEGEGADKEDKLQIPAQKDYRTQISVQKDFGFMPLVNKTNIVSYHSLRQDTPLLLPVKEKVQLFKGGEDEAATKPFQDEVNEIESELQREKVRFTEPKLAHHNRFNNVNMKHFNKLNIHQNTTREIAKSLDNDKPIPRREYHRINSNANGAAVKQGPMNHSIYHYNRQNTTEKIPKIPVQQKPQPDNITKGHSDDQTRHNNHDKNLTEKYNSLDQITANPTKLSSVEWSSGKLVKLPKQPPVNNRNQSDNIHTDLPEMSNWSPWSTCSAPCGTNALQIRTRKCISEPSNIACKKNVVDWSPCVEKLICKNMQAQHSPSSLRIIVNEAANKILNIDKAMENQNTRFQWGPWTLCMNKCGVKSIRVRRRICPSERSVDTGVCLKPTMQWVWCKPTSCNLFESTKLKNNKGLNQKTPYNKVGKKKLLDNTDDTTHPNFHSMVKPHNASHVIIHKDNGIRFITKCSTSPWSRWSLCSRTCGENSRKFRTRSCLCHVKAECDQPIMEWRHCTLRACPGEENYGPWSEFSQCSKTCGGGWRKRIRHCIKKKKLQSSHACSDDLLIGVRVCNVKRCLVKAYGQPAAGITRQESPHKEINNFITDIIQPREDPEASCGFIPCEEFGCLDNAFSKCKADRNCDPVFYDLSGNVEHRCTDWGRYFIKKPTMFCGSNPCRMTRCPRAYGRCFVDLKCRPIVVGYDGSLIDCRQKMAVPFKRTLFKSASSAAN